MRFFFWPLAVLWVLKWSLSAGMVMTVSVHDPVHDPVHVTTPTSQIHHAEYALAATAPPPDCHGSRAAQAQPTTDVVTLSPESSDTSHCTDHADCHHCCPLAWVNWADIGKPHAPAVHLTGNVHNWHSASWVPGLRPPKA